MPIIAVECDVAFVWMGNKWICCYESVVNLHSTMAYLRKGVAQERKRQTEKRDEIVETDIRIFLNEYRAYEPLASNICSCMTFQNLNTNFPLAKFLQPVEIISSISVVLDAQCVRLYWSVIQKCPQLHCTACPNALAVSLSMGRLVQLSDHMCRNQHSDYNRYPHALIRLGDYFHSRRRQPRSHPHVPELRHPGHG